MLFQIANQKQFLKVLFFAPLLGAFLAFGFQPFCLSLATRIGLSNSQPLIFIALAFFFFISLPDPSAPRIYRYSKRRLLTLCALPWLISVGFGAFKSPAQYWDSQLLAQNLIWSWIIAPLAEELLFRGWVIALFNRWLQSAFSPVEPFLPLSVWASALSFSFWHLQNLSNHSLGFTLFQLFYTLFVGIWLGVLKWQTGSIAIAFGAHFLLNFAADWKLLFML